MPEIAEVERARTILEQILKDQTIVDVEAFDDAIVFKDTTAKEFAAALKGKKVVCAKRWGKYFWLEMDSPPHPVMHLGMTGWIRVRGALTHYHPSRDEEQWPPRFVKFILKIAEPKAKPNLDGSKIPEIWGTEIAMVDARRLGRIRLVDAKDPFAQEPLNELGFDPILKMPDFKTFAAGVKKRKVPIKALLLDQSFSAGVGNWVADEGILTRMSRTLTVVLYQAAVHPEQYSNTLPDSALKELHKKIHSVCTIAAEVLGDSSKFPADWLFSYRWGKSARGKKGGKEESNVLPNGEKIIHLTVGGRTSAVVLSRQKKLKGDDGDEDEDAEEKAPAKKARKTADSGVKGKKEKVAEENGDKEEKELKRKAKEEVGTPAKRRLSAKDTKSSPKSTPTRKSSRNKG